MISIMKKNKCLLLPCTLLVVGLMTISVSLEGSAQDQFENVRKVWNGANQKQTNPEQSNSNKPQSDQTSISRSRSSNSNPIQRSRTSQTSTPPANTPKPGTSNPVETENDNTPSAEGVKGFLNQNIQGNEAKGGNTINKIINNFGNQGSGEGTNVSQIISDEIGKSEEDRKIEASRKYEEELEQKIDAVYEEGLKLKEDIKQAEAERDGFNGAGLSPERAEAKYNELDVKCLELRSYYEILVLELEELQEEYAKLIGE